MSVIRVGSARSLAKNYGATIARLGLDWFPASAAVEGQTNRHDPASQVALSLLTFVRVTLRQLTQTFVHYLLTISLAPLTRKNCRRPDISVSKALSSLMAPRSSNKRGWGWVEGGGVGGVGMVHENGSFHNS